MYYGQGGFIYSEVYNMPIHIRRFHIKKINDLHEEKNKAHEDAMSKSQQNVKSIPKMPNIPKNLRR